ncbi:NTT1 [Enterospora canceri]|uniref:ADP,ATP carrier protein n=1 Tax=Enterospora canceri TaxID=1081671 RepID=A0A1Y1S8P7_9MICR|nr:NTT1 [Enterospora canceri]
MSHSTDIGKPITTDLPTYEEYKEAIEAKKNTAIGSIAPFIPSEYKRVALANLSFFLVGLTYAFIRQFKEILVLDTFQDATVAIWLELLTFCASITILGVVNRIHAKHGVNRGTSMFILFFIGLYLAWGFLTVFDRFVIEKGVAQEIMSGSRWTIRGLNIFRQPLIMLNNLVMTLFYVILDSSTSFLIGCGYMMYFTANVTHEQMSRYIFLILLGANASLFFSVFLAKFMARLIDQRAIASTKWIYYCASICVASLFYGALYFMKRLSDREFRKPLYVGHVIGQQTPKAKTNVGLSQSLRIVCRTPWLLGMCLFAVAYNFASAIDSVTSMYSFVAYSDFLQQNPHMNRNPGQGDSSSALSSKYKSIECFLTSAISVYLMLVPVFKRIFGTVGILGFAAVVCAACTVPDFLICLFSTINYPFTHFGERSLFTFGINSATAYFEWEAFLVMTSNLLSKVGKYSFYDVIKESLSVKIDPEKRIIYKGIFDGLAQKIGKLLASIYVIVLVNVFHKNDVRYFAFLTFMIRAALFGLVFFMMIKVHADYKRAVQNDTYLDNSGKSPVGDRLDSETVR